MDHRLHIFVADPGRLLHGAVKGHIMVPGELQIQTQLDAHGRLDEVFEWYNVSAA